MIYIDFINDIIVFCFIDILLLYVDVTVSKCCCRLDLQVCQVQWLPSGLFQ